MTGRHYRAIALYSGGVDSIIAPLLALEDLDLQREDMLLLYIDLGGGSSNRKKRAGERARTMGMDFAAVEGRAEFARDYLSQAILMNGSYWGYPLITPLSRAFMVEAAASFLNFGSGKTCYLVNGCTRYQNTRYRLEKHCARYPQFLSVTPFAHRTLSRGEKIDILRNNGMEPGRGADIAEDDNLWGRALEGSPLNDLSDIEAKVAYRMTQDVRASSDSPDRFTLRFAEGLPIAFDDGSVTLSALDEIIGQCGKVGGKHGVGRIVIFEDTIPELGYKERGVFESPASTVIYTAHRFIEDAVLTHAERVLKRDIDQQWAEIVYRGGWFDANRHELSAVAHGFQSRVSGDVSVEVFLGHVRVTNAVIPDCRPLGPQSVGGEY